MGERERIILFHGGALGDLINTLPALSALRKKFAAAEITAVGKRTWLELFQLAGVVDEVISLDRPGMHHLFGESGLGEEFLSWLAGFDRAVSWIRSPLLLRHLEEAGLKLAAFTAPFPSPPGSPHVTEYLAQPLQALDITLSSFFPRLNLPPEIKAKGPSFPGIILHPGSGSPGKNWPAERWAEAARQLQKISGQKAAVLVGPADEEPASKVMDELKGAVIFRGLNNCELASLLAGAALLIGNDSGVSHLAGALGTPVVAVYGPTDPNVWGVRQRHALNLSARASCSPCSREERNRCSTRKCMEGVSVEEVVRAAERLLSLIFSPGSSPRAASPVNKATLKRRGGKSRE